MKILKKVGYILCVLFVGFSPAILKKLGKQYSKNDLRFNKEYYNDSEEEPFEE